MRCSQGFRNVSLSNVISFYERYRLITMTVYAYKLNNARNAYIIAVMKQFFEIEKSLLNTFPTTRF